MSFISVAALPSHSLIQRSCRQYVSRNKGIPPFPYRSNGGVLTGEFASTSLSGIQETDSMSQGRPIKELPKILLKRNRQTKSFRDGSQLVFSGSIDKVPSKIAMGDLVQVEVPASDDPSNQNTQLVGWGVYNPESMYRIRILQHALLNPKMKNQIGDNSDVDFLESLLNSQFKKALKTRQALGLPSETTDTYRLVNGEGDCLSGLAVDIIANRVAVIMSSAAWCQVHQPIILKCLGDLLPNYELIWKTTQSRLRQDGMEISEQDNMDGSADNKDNGPVIGMENGIKFQTFPHLPGQKTSVYCDQRENRWNLAQLCHGKNVLDLCCYHGGFSLNAANHGASTVVGVDSSQEAIDTCLANALLNNLQDRVQFTKSDISVYMKSCNENFDVIVLDPPKLAPSASGLDKASRKYQSLNRDALKLISANGGLFMTCTCSAAMTQKDGGKFFLQMVQQASLGARREISLLRVSGAAPCHTQSPVSFPAGNYLTAALFYVHPIL